MFCYIFTCERFTEFSEHNSKEYSKRRIEFIIYV